MLPNTFEIKTVLMGDSGVGKTSLVHRFVLKNFNENIDATMGAGFMTKVLMSDEHNVRFQIWDTAGQEKYHSLAPIYYRDAQIAILVYDITNQQSFEVLQKWIADLKQNGPSELVMYIVGNKIDLDESERITYDQATSLAKEYNAVVKLTSAKENKGIEELFQSIADHFVQKKWTESQRINSNYLKHNTKIQIPGQGGCKC